MMNIVAYIAGALFAAAALFAVVRIWRGPSILDRMVAADMLLSTLICVLGAEMVYNHHTRTLPVALVLAMFAFVGSVSVARFATKQKNSDPQGGPDGTSPIDPSLDELSSIDEPVVERSVERSVNERPVNGRSVNGRSGGER
jgi:multicomponent Na+:H+ antiporter subunit F